MCQMGKSIPLLAVVVATVVTPNLEVFSINHHPGGYTVTNIQNGDMTTPTYMPSGKVVTPDPKYGQPGQFYGIYRKNPRDFVLMPDDDGVGDG